MTEIAKLIERLEKATEPDRDELLAPPKVQQLVTQDEINAGEIEQLWLDAVCKKFGRPEFLPAEVASEPSEKDTRVTTVWSRGHPVALAIRQRTAWNFTVLTLVEVRAPIEGPAALRARQAGDGHE